MTASIWSVRPLNKFITYLSIYNVHRFALDIPIIFCTVNCMASAIETMGKVTKTPPVNGFWSLTMYNPEYFFVEKPLNRYTDSSRNELKYNPDGSLDLYIQQDPPVTDKESNWLPAPTDRFVLMLRFYWPQASLLNGVWKPPAVQMIKQDCFVVWEL